MSNREIFGAYVLPAIVSLLAAAAAFLGNQMKRLYEKYINDRKKEAVVRTCVKAVEQLYHDLSGPEKLLKAQEGVVQMLNEKGIPISELEMNLLIEAVVSEFNYGFAKASEAISAPGDQITCGTSKLPEGINLAGPDESYSEEGGGQ